MPYDKDNTNVDMFIEFTIKWLALCNISFYPWRFFFCARRFVICLSALCDELVLERNMLGVLGHTYKQTYHHVSLSYEICYDVTRTILIALLWRQRKKCQIKNHRKYEMMKIKTLNFITDFYEIDLCHEKSTKVKTK